MVFAMAFHQLRIYKFRMDMAVAGLRWTYLRVVNLNCCRLVGYCTAVTKLWNQFSQISIMRGTNDYHGIMALILVIGYGIVCIYNIRLKDKTKKIPVLWILVIGILVQFGWEFVLNITGIRNQSLQTLIVNSLLETNLGLPYLYFIHRAVHKRRDEALHKQLPDNETVFTS